MVASCCYAGLGCSSIKLGDIPKREKYFEGGGEELVTTFSENHKRPNAKQWETATFIAYSERIFIPSFQIRSFIINSKKKIKGSSINCFEIILYGYVNFQMSTSLVCLHSICKP